MGREVEVIGRGMLVELSSRKEVTFQRRENANGIYWRLVTGKGGREPNGGGASVSKSHRTVYTYVTVGVVLYALLHSFPISKEVKRVYRFLFHIRLSHSLNHTNSFPPQVSKWIQGDRKKWEWKKEILFHTLTIARLSVSSLQLHGGQWSWNYFFMHGLWYCIVIFRHP